MAGRLFTELRDKQGLAYSTGAINPSRVDPSVLVAYLGTAPANADRAEEGMLRELGRMGRERVTPEELARAKSFLLGQFNLDRRTNARLAWYQAFFEATGVGYDFADRYVKAVESVTADEVLRVAQTYLAAPAIVSLRPAPR
jgi:zinc protease